MGVQITTAFVQQYSTNIAMLLQQQGSRLRNTVTEQAFTGKAATFVEQFGSVSPVKNQARNSDTPITDVPQDRRWVYPLDYDWATLIDQQQRHRSAALRLEQRQRGVIGGPQRVRRPSAIG